MKRIAVAVVALFVATATGTGQHTVTSMPSLAQQQVRTTKVRFAVGPMGQGEEFTPGVGQSGSWPGIVVIPDVSGLNDTIRTQSRSISAQGYLVLAVDLYDGHTPSSSEEAERWMKALPDEETASKIGAAISFLQNWMGEPEKVGMVAWGAGGSYALRVAAREQKLKAVVVNYGPLSHDGFILSHITSPVLVNVGALDGTTSLERISSFVAAIKISPSREDVKIYPYAAHSFEDAQSENYRSADAADADRRIKLFLAKRLKGGQ